MPRIADMLRDHRHVSKVPGTDSCAAYSEDWFNRPYRVRVIQEIESKIGLDQNRRSRERVIRTACDSRSRDAKAALVGEV